VSNEDRFEYGHSREYWMREGGINLELLVMETFANMAAAAIANPDALNVMSDYLPRTHAMFIRILERMIR
jgi:hypothetical protein